MTMDASASIREQVELPLHPRYTVSRRPAFGPQGRRALKTAGLFAGIGGIELGLERAGHHCVQLCEIDSGAVEVLRTRLVHNPRIGRAASDIEIVPDVRQLAVSAALARDTELLAAGFPCTDLSQAGRTAGFDGSQSGLVWSVLDLLKARDVPWVLFENVPNMLRLGRGAGFRVLLGRLEALGYRWAYRVVDTRAFNLPQRRQRVVLVASKDGDPKDVLFGDDARHFGAEPWGWDGERACGFYWTEGVRGLGWAVDAVPTLKGGSTVGVPSPPAVIWPHGRIITPGIEDAERLQGFPKGWTRPAERVARRGFRWRLVGNAVSVPVARWLGERLARPRPARLEAVREVAEKEALPEAAWSAGGRICTAAVSRWPRRPRNPRHLADFLGNSVTPLSLRATAGFYERATTQSRLRFPEGFLDAVKRHRDAMSSGAAR